MNNFYKSPPISAQFSVVRFTVNSQHHSGATGIDIKLSFPQNLGFLPKYFLASLDKSKKKRFLGCVFLGNWDNIYYCYIKAVGIGIIHLSLLELCALCALCG